MGILRFFESGMSMRQTTLQKVLAGRMNPVERRLKLLERRRSRLFERDQSAIEASASEVDVEEVMRALWTIGEKPFKVAIRQ